MFPIIVAKSSGLQRVLDAPVAAGPDMEDAVAAGGEYRLAVGADGDASDGVVNAFKRCHPDPGRDVVQLDRLVAAATDEFRREATTHGGTASQQPSQASAHGDSGPPPRAPTGP